MCHIINRLLGLVARNVQPIAYSLAWMAATILSITSRSLESPGRWLSTMMEKITVRPLAASR